MFGRTPLTAESKSGLYKLDAKVDDVDPNNNYQLWRLFFVAQSVMGRVRDLELSGMGVTPEQSGALFLLAARGKSTIGEMADAWVRQRNSVSTLMERMARQGLVKKVKVPKQKDLEIEITAKGREMFKRIVASGQIFDLVFSSFSEKDRMEFARYLKMVLSRSRTILHENNKKGQAEND
jgi:DNA-binding MarR family transcriptional regulator